MGCGQQALDTGLPKFSVWLLLQHTKGFGSSSQGCEWVLPDEQVGVQVI